MEYGFQLHVGPREHTRRELARVMLCDSRRDSCEARVEVMAVKNRFLLVGLSICGAVNCVGARSQEDGGKDRSRSEVSDEGGTDNLGRDAGSDSSVDIGDTDIVGDTEPGENTKPGNDTDPDSSTNPGGDTEPVVDWETLLSDGGVALGDHIGDLEVVGVQSFYGCTTIELQGAAAFECSETQLAALGADRHTSETFASTDSAALAASSCDELANIQRPLLQQTLSSRLERNYLNQLAEYCLAPIRRVHVVDGEQVEYCPYGFVDAGAVSEEQSVEEDEATEYSTTNTQVASVDEADYVKNDGNTIYVLNGQSLVVFDAWPVEELKEVARVTLPAEPRRMFLAANRLVVYLRVGAVETDEATCTYGYSCRSSSEGGSTLVHVYDVSEPALPVLLKAYEFSGSYLASRRIGDAVFSVVHDQGAAPPPGADTSVNGATPDALEEQYTEKKAALTELVDGMPTEYFLPWITEREPGQSTVTSAGCDDALAASASRGTSFVSLVGFDLATLGAPSSTLIASKPGFVYASPESLYLAVDGVDGQDDTFSSPWAYYGDVEDDQTTIHKFELDGIATKYSGSQAIPGHILNQFSMDEHSDVLRVATSNGWVPDPDVSSNIITLGEKDDEFAVLGELRGLAPQEDIRSVRFDGERGFVVTFKKTDPLFVIGLSDPTEPAVLGELKIPGFSTYMHMLDESHLLAVGFDADDHGDFAYFDGIQVQIFDVTDLTDPKLQHKAVIGTRGSGSEALLDHLAFNYFPSRNVLALPATICAGGDDGQFGDEFEFAGLVVFDVSLDNGITERGRLPFATPADLEPGESTGCGNWWTEARSLVKRSIFMEDYAIGLSEEWLKAAALSDLGTVLRSVPISE